MKLIAVLLALGLWTVAMYSYGYQEAYDTFAPAPVVAQEQPGVFTSQDVWQAVNSYRQGKGIAPLQVYEPLCDNLVARYHAIKERHDHTGFAAFVDEQIANGVIPYDMRVTEVFASGYSAKETVDAWAGSMGHELAITKGNRGCAYTHNGLSIILMTD